VAVAPPAIAASVASHSHSVSNHNGDEVKVDVNVSVDVDDNERLASLTESPENCRLLRESVTTKCDRLNCVRDIFKNEDYRNALQMFDNAKSFLVVKAVFIQLVCLEDDYFGVGDGDQLRARSQAQGPIFHNPNPFVNDLPLPPQVSVAMPVPLAPNSCAHQFPDFHANPNLARQNFALNNNHNQNNNFQIPFPASASASVSGVNNDHNSNSNNNSAVAVAAADPEMDDCLVVSLFFYMCTHILSICI
jgi:hypothetical protein